MHTFDASLAGLRARLPRELCDRLPADDRLDAWLEVLGPEGAVLFDGLAPSDAERLCDALVAIGEPGAAVLERADARAGDKRVRKAIRRALHRLRSRGVEVSAARPASRGSVLKPLAQREQAFVSAIDPTGQRAVYLISPLHGRFRILQLLVGDRSGIVRIDPLEGRRGDTRRFVRELERGKLKVAPTEPRFARALLRRLETAGDEAAARVDPALVAEATRGDAAPTPGEDLRQRLAAGQMSRMSGAEADALLRARVERGAVPPWPLGGDDVGEAAGDLDDVEQSPLVLSELQKRERRERVVADVARRALDAPTRERLASRLEETGVLLEADGDADGSLASVAVAAQIRQAQDPLTVPYLRSLLELSLELAREERRREARGRLIMPG